MYPLSSNHLIAAIIRITGEKKMNIAVKNPQPCMNEYMTLSANSVMVLNALSFGFLIAAVLETSELSRRHPWVNTPFVSLPLLRKN